MVAYYESYRNVRILFISNDFIMKKKWEEITTQLVKAEKSLQDFLDNGGLSTPAIIKSKDFIKQWELYTAKIKDFETYISPVDPLEIKFPFKSEALTEMWQRWKDYLGEQHGQLVRTRSEKSALEHLMELSKGDEEKAVKFLRYAMTCRYKNFFAIDEKDTKEPAKSETGVGSDF